MFGFLRITDSGIVANATGVDQPGSKRRHAGGRSRHGFSFRTHRRPVCRSTADCRAHCYRTDRETRYEGGAALFLLSLGMGAPLIAFGASAGRLLPKAGPWMNAVKAAFGILLLGVAIWMLERIIPPAATLVLWAALLVGSGVFMGAMSPPWRIRLRWAANSARRWDSSRWFMASYCWLARASGGSDPVTTTSRWIAWRQAPGSVGFQAYQVHCRSGPGAGVGKC